MLAGFVGGSPITKADGTFALTGLVPNTPVTLHAEYGEHQTDTVPIEKYRTDPTTIEVGPGMVREGVVLRLHSHHVGEARQQG